MVKNKNISMSFLLVLVLGLISETYSLSTTYNLYPSGIFVIICMFFGVLGVVNIIGHVGFVFKYFKSPFLSIFLFVIYCIINLKINNVSYGEVYIFLKDILYILFAVWFLFFTLKNEQLISLKLIMEKVFYIQIPIIIFQYIYYNYVLRLGEISGTEDLTVGFMGKQMTGHIGILTVFIGIDAIDKYYKTKNIKELIKIIILFILQFIMSVKVAIIFWIIGTIYVFKKQLIRINIRSVVLAVSLILVIVLVPKFFTERDVLSKKYAKFTQMQISNFTQGYENVRLARTAGIIITLNYLDNTKQGIFLGNGIGTTKAAQQFGIYGRYYPVFSSTRYLGLLDNSFNFLYYEIGVIGLIILMIYFFSFLPENSKILRIKILIFCSLIFYTHSLDNNFLTVYMSILLAISLNEKLKEKELKNNKVI